MLQVDKDLREMLIQPNAPAPKRIGLRVWPKAIPQFNLGHLEAVQVLISPSSGYFTPLPVKLPCFSFHHSVCVESYHA